MHGSSSTGVLIVGAGPVGLAMAVLLLMQDVPVRIIEAQDEHPTSSRGTALQSRMLEVLSFIGVIDDVLEVSTPPLHMRVYAPPDGRTPLKDIEWSQPVNDSPSVPYRNLVTVSQGGLEAAMRSCIHSLGGKVELSTTLVDVQQNEDGVVAETVFKDRAQAGCEVRERKEYMFLAAADGAKGRTRKMMNVQYVGESRPAERMFVADVTAEGIDGDFWHRWGDLGSLAVLLKPLLPKPRFQLQAIGPSLPETVPGTIDGIQAFFTSVSGRNDIVLSNLTWSSIWRANIRMVDKFSTGRVYFLGDSAHCHSPAGGQGITTGIMDSFNLAWKLSLSYRGLASEQLLPSYEFERMPVVAEMLDLSSVLHERIITERIRVPLGADGKAALDPMYRDNKLSQLWVNYRWSPIVVDERFSNHPEQQHRHPFGVEGDTLQAGDRAPDATLLQQLYPVVSDNDKSITLFKTLTPTAHTLLIFPANDFNCTSLENLSAYQKMGVMSITFIVSASSQSTHIEGGRTFLDVASFARDSYGLSPRLADSPTHYFVIRPDGIIGAFGTAVDVVQEYFSKILRVD